GETTWDVLIVLIIFVVRKACTESDSDFTTEGLPPTEPEVPAPIEVDVIPDLRKAEHTLLEISWKSYHYTSTPIYIIELYVGQMDSDESTESMFDPWLLILETTSCCNISYHHIGKTAVTKVRIAAEVDGLTSEYTESEKVFLPNFRESTLSLNADFVSYSEIYLRFLSTCSEKFSSLRLSYRHINTTYWQFNEYLSKDAFHTVIERPKSLPRFAIQLFAHDDTGQLVAHSEPIFQNFNDKPPSDSSNKNRLVLEKTGPMMVHINVVHDEVFKSKNVRYDLLIDSEFQDSPRRISFTSRDKSFPMAVELDRFDLYFFHLEFVLMENLSIRGKTERVLFYTEEGIPDKVTNATIQLLLEESTEQYAVFFIKWNEPIKKTGYLKEYKIRWKFARSPYDIFSVEQCEKHYYLKAYSHHTRYQVFISASTSKGYGPEVELNFNVGSPDDWAEYDPDLEETVATDPPTTTMTTSTTLSPPPNPHQFEAKLRKEIGREYHVGPMRLVISVLTFIVCIVCAFILKNEFLPMSEFPRRGRSRRFRQDARRRKKAQAMTMSASKETK
ncbi:hypothetical protein V3C99_011004, partial [Haemonchus contortus]